MKRPPKIPVEPLAGANIDILPSLYRKRLLRRQKLGEKRLEGARGKLERARLRIDRLTAQLHFANEVLSRTIADFEKAQQEAELLGKL